MRRGDGPRDCPQKDTLADPKTGSRSSGAGRRLSRPRGRTGRRRRATTTRDRPHMIERRGPRNVVATYASARLPPATPRWHALGPRARHRRRPCSARPDHGPSGRRPGAHSLLVDRQYACIFQLPPRASTTARRSTRAPSKVTRATACRGAIWDAGSPSATGNTDDEIPPLCSKTSTDGTITSAVGDYTVQTYAKAYPTIRELTLAAMMGDQGVVSSPLPHPRRGHDPATTRSTATARPSTPSSIA